MNLSIQTAQNTHIDYKIAGVAERVFATFIDFTVIGGLTIVLSMIVSFSDALQKSTIVIVVIFSLLSLYHLVLELCLNGRSIGKMALYIQVVRLDGKKLTGWDCLLRWMFRLVDITICLGIIGMISIIVTKKGQRLGDLAAGTTVVYRNRSVTLKQLDRYSNTDNYEVVYPQVRMLSDKDINIIKEVLAEARATKEYELLEPLSHKIKELTGIQSDQNNLEFIQTILRDYTHITQ